MNIKPGTSLAAVAHRELREENRIRERIRELDEMTLGDAIEAVFGEKYAKMVISDEHRDVPMRDLKIRMGRTEDGGTGARIDLDGLSKEHHRTLTDEQRAEADDALREQSEMTEEEVKKSAMVYALEEGVRKYQNHLTEADLKRLLEDKSDDPNDTE